MSTNTISPIEAILETLVTAVANRVIDRVLDDPRLIGQLGSMHSDINTLTSRVDELSSTSVPVGTFDMHCWANDKANVDDFLNHRNVTRALEEFISNQYDDFGLNYKQEREVEDKIENTDFSVRNEVKAVLEDNDDVHELILSLVMDNITVTTPNLTR